MSLSIDYLKGLPEPAIIENVSFEELRQDAIDDLQARDPSYDAILESDPAIKNIEANSYQNLLTRIRINDAAKANLLAFAERSDLDHLVAFYDVVRLEGEDDLRLSIRVVLAIQGRSTAGPEERYMGIALGASLRVADVRVYKVSGGPKLRLAILSTDNGGVADAPLLAAVKAAVESTSVICMNDVIEVVAAAQSVTNVAAEIWLLPDAPQTVFNGLEQRLRDAWTAESGIGFDMAESWLKARLHGPGVSKVNILAPVPDKVVGDNEATSLGTVTLTYMGRRR